MSEQHESHHPNYTKIYIWLLILLVISVAGPFLEITWVTLVTAFGIAVVKATLVIQNFMHLKWERAIVKWMLATSVVFMGLLFFGVAPDVMEHEGQRWVNVSAQEAVARGIPTEDHGEEGEDHAAEGEDHAEEGAAAEDHAEEEGSSGESGEATAAAAQEFDARGTYNIACATCHGQAGDGNGPAGAALEPPPADFTSSELWAQSDTARMFEIIKEGGAANGLSPLMVSWKASYDDQQIRALVEYIESEFKPEG